LGQVLVFAAVGMVLFLAVAGLVIDLGLLWTTRRHMQTAADAAAIANHIAVLLRASRQKPAPVLPKGQRMPEQIQSSRPGRQSSYWSHCCACRCHDAAIITPRYPDHVFGLSDNTFAEFVLSTCCFSSSASEYSFLMSV
jgi:Putative Flp pilus-assembly TadE/G-like